MSKLQDLFEVEYGTNLELNRLKICPRKSADCVNFVSRTERNNGVSAIVALEAGIKPLEAGLITVAAGGSVLAAFVQEEPFYTGRDMYYLRPKQAMTFGEKFYYCLCIRRNRYRYSYGRQANRTLRNLIVPSQVPSWIDQLSIVEHLNATGSERSHELTMPVPLSSWRTFKYSDLFDIKKGQRITKRQMKAGATRCIRPIDKNNGVIGYISTPPNHPGNVITVAYNGSSVAEAFYQPEPIFALDDVNVLHPKFNLTPEIALFLTALIRKEKYRFSYGRKWHVERMQDSVIRLPVTADGKPDWDSIESYMKDLPLATEIA